MKLGFILHKLHADDHDKIVVMRLCKKEKLIKLVFYNLLFVLQNKIDLNDNAQFW